MMNARRLLLATTLLFAVPTVSALSADVAHADAPKKDPLADAFAGQIFFLDSAPPASVGGPAWFSAHKITKKDENSDQKWPLHIMIFLKKPLDVNKIDLMVYRTDKKGVKEFVQKLEQFPSGDGRSFYFLITFRKQTPYEPNMKYSLKAVSANGAGLAESGDIELNGKEEKIGGGDMDFTKGMDLSKPKEEKPTAPFDAEATKEALKKIIYEDCKTSASKGGEAKIKIVLAAKDGKALKVEFEKDPPPPYSDATQLCIVRRFEKTKTKPFTGADHPVTYKVVL